MKPKFTVLFDGIESGAIDASKNEILTIQEFGDGSIVFYENVMTGSSCLRMFINHLYEVRQAYDLKHVRVVLRDLEAKTTCHTLCYF